MRTRNNKSKEVYDHRHNWQLIPCCQSKEAAVANRWQNKCMLFDRHRVGPYSKRLWPRAWKCCPRPQAERTISKTEVTVFFTIRTDPKPANNLFIFFLTLSNQLFNSLSSIHTIQTHLVIKICFEKKAFFFQLPCRIKALFKKCFALKWLCKQKDKSSLKCYRARGQRSDPRKKPIGLLNSLPRLLGKKNYW